VKQFYRHVKISVGHEWKKTIGANTQLDSKRQSLAKQILKLREVKFPKALFSLLQSTQRKLSPNEIHGIVSICRPLNGRRKPFKLAKAVVYILCGEATAYKELEEKARALAKKPPLSKYGLIAEIFATPLSSFLQTEQGLLAKCQDIVYPLLRVKCVTTSFTQMFIDQESYIQM
jgi:hypothetical protein